VKSESNIASAAQFVKCILLHAYPRKTAALSCASTNKNGKCINII